MEKNGQHLRSKKLESIGKVPKVHKGSLIRLENMKQLLVSPKVLHKLNKKESGFKHPKQPFIADSTRMMMIKKS